MKCDICKAINSVEDAKKHPTSIECMLTAKRKLAFIMQKQRTREARVCPYHRDLLQIPNGVKAIAQQLAELTCDMAEHCKKMLERV